VTLTSIDAWERLKEVRKILPFEMVKYSEIVKTLKKDG
jgi:hypothetical protein